MHRVSKFNANSVVSVPSVWPALRLGMLRGAGRFDKLERRRRTSTSFLDRQGLLLIYHGIGSLFSTARRSARDCGFIVSDRLDSWKYNSDDAVRRRSAATAPSTEPQPRCTSASSHRRRLDCIGRRFGGYYFVYYTQPGPVRPCFLGLQALGAARYV
jgi:hypothetical protein